MHLQKLLMEMYHSYLLHIKLIKTPEIDAVVCCKLAMTHDSYTVSICSEAIYSLMTPVQSMIQSFTSSSTMILPFKGGRRFTKPYK